MKISAIPHQFKERIRALFFGAKKEYTWFWVLTITTKVVILILLLYFLWKARMVWG